MEGWNNNSLFDVNPCRQHPESGDFNQHLCLNHWLIYGLGARSLPDINLLLLSNKKHAVIFIHVQL